jgi:hypothetical protein
MHHTCVYKRQNSMWLPLSCRVTPRKACQSFNRVTMCAGRCDHQLQLQTSHAHIGHRCLASNLQHTVYCHCPLSSDMHAASSQPRPTGCPTHGARHINTCSKPWHAHTRPADSHGIHSMQSAHGQDTVIAVGPPQ